MPVKYICRKCGYVLWEFKRVGQDCYGLPTPSEVIAFYGGICPNCKRELSKPTLNDIHVRLKGEQISINIPQVQESLIGVQGSNQSYTVEAY